MKFIINQKIYDTEKAELIIEFMKEWRVRTIVGAMAIRKPTELYKTKKGNYFTVAKADCGKHHVNVESEEDVKRILSNCGAVEIYNKYFEELEEG